MLRALFSSTNLRNYHLYSPPSHLSVQADPTQNTNHHHCFSTDLQTLPHLPLGCHLLPPRLQICHRHHRTVTYPSTAEPNASLHPASPMPMPEQATAEPSLRLSASMIFQLYLDHSPALSTEHGTPLFHRSDDQFQCTSHPLSPESATATTPIILHAQNHHRSTCDQPLRPRPFHLVVTTSANLPFLQSAPLLQSPPQHPSTAVLSSPLPVGEPTYCCHCWRSPFTDPPPTTISISSDSLLWRRRPKSELRPLQPPSPSLHFRLIITSTKPDLPKPSSTFNHRLPLQIHARDDQICPPPPRRSCDHHSNNLLRQISSSPNREPL